MIYLITCVDGPDGARLRQEHLAEHLSYIETVSDRLRLAGPIVDLGGIYRGSILIYEADSEPQAQALVMNDPYGKARVWSSISILPFKPVAGTYIGGKTW